MQESITQLSRRRVIRLHAYFWLLLLGWTATFSGFSWWQVRHFQSVSMELAEAEAQANFNKDQAFRHWATLHGGVYVPATRETPPNPYLDHIEERDISTPSGRELTLMNPAYMLRQLNEQFGDMFGVRGNITSLDPLRTENAPDAWERAALHAFGAGVTEVQEITWLDGEPHLRYMAPMYVETGCLQCHDHQSYQVGNVLGGVSVALPLASYIEYEQAGILRTLSGLGIIWTLGSIGLIISSRRLRADARRQLEAHQAINKLNEGLERSLEQTIEAIAATIETRDPYTAGHQRRTAIIACAIAQELGLDDERIRGLRVAANIHDIGKNSIPAELLSRPARLTPAEFELIKVHPESGYDIVRGIDFPWPVAEIVRQHHERIDGSGYPHGLRGDEILLESRILAVADVVEAITSHRPYRPALDMAVAVAELREYRGTRYDPAVVDAFLRLLDSGRLPDLELDS